mmetsp:Transcript_44464/g.106053  ORF Transcript_44464/g.106053 Transcript_44464/m.106053 type:complete len:384 (+) Transcript_44464:6688-7839(+)
MPRNGNIASRKRGSLGLQVHIRLLRGPRAVRDVCGVRFKLSERARLRVFRKLLVQPRVLRGPRGLLDSDNLPGVSSKQLQRAVRPSHGVRVRELHGARDLGSCVPGGNIVRLPTRSIRRPRKRGILHPLPGKHVQLAYKPDGGVSLRCVPGQRCHAPHREHRQDGLHLRQRLLRPMDRRGPHLLLLPSRHIQQHPRNHGGGAVRAMPRKRLRAYRLRRARGLRVCRRAAHQRDDARVPRMSAGYILGRGKPRRDVHSMPLQLLLLMGRNILHLRPWLLRLRKRVVTMSGVPFELLQSDARGGEQRGVCLVSDVLGIGRGVRRPLSVCMYPRILRAPPLGHRVHSVPNQHVAAARERDQLVLVRFVWRGRGHAQRERGLRGVMT